MGRLKDLTFGEGIYEPDDTEISEGVYPKRLHVDGYDVNHYHDGDVPVYEILDDKGNIIDVAHSTNEMHQITGSKNRDDGDE